MSLFEKLFGCAELDREPEPEPDHEHSWALLSAQDASDFYDTAQTRLIFRCDVGSGPHFKTKMILGIWSISELLSPPA